MPKITLFSLFCFALTAVAAQAATYTVTNTANAGTGSLRQAVADAITAPGADTIVFQSSLAGQTITLSSQILLSNDITSDFLFIDASSLQAGGGLTLWGGGTTRHFRLGPDGYATLRGLTLTGGNGWDPSNGPIYYYGGAIFNEGTLTLEQCTLSGNSAPYNGGISWGGAILNEGMLTIDQCSIWGNTGRDGGAIFSSYFMTVKRSTLSGNSATSGGAIANYGYDMVLTHCTVSGNFAIEGGGIYLDIQVPEFSSVHLTNSIIAGNMVDNNTVANGPDIKPFSGTITSGGRNLIGNNSTISTQFPAGQPNANNDYVGSSTVSLNALLTPLGNYGGFTKTMHLLDGSPALNRITPPLFTTDQRGSSITGAADIGAHENGPLPTISSIPNQTVMEDYASQHTVTFSISSGLGSTLNATSPYLDYLVSDVVCSNSGASGYTTISLIPNRSGNSPITVTLTNAEGKTASVSFVLTVIPVDDAPSFTKGPEISVRNNSGWFKMVDWATNLSQNDDHGAGQALNFLVSIADDKKSLFLVQPTINVYGELSFALAPSALTTGSIIVTTTVRLQDSGRGAPPPHKNLSDPQTFTITISNPPPPVELTVTNLSDQGPGSLRAMIATALSGSGDKKIVFPSSLNGQTITLTNEIVLNDTNSSDILFIEGPSGGITISCNGNNRVFNLSTTQSAVLRNLTLTGGHSPATDENGGAISNNGNLTLEQCTLSGNSASYGGGAISNTGGLTLLRCTLSGNLSGLGGAIRNLGGSKIYMAQCTLSANSASDHGGAFCNHGELIMSQCTLSGNSASVDSGGIRNHLVANLTLTQCTLSGNSAANTGGKGGGIYNQWTGILTNSIIAGNTASTGPDIYLSGNNMTRMGQNLIGNNSNAATLFPSGLPNVNGDYVGSSVAPLVPLLAALGDNGGPTWTRALLPSSPALNRITPPLFPTDQRGSPIVGSADIGAFELQ